MARTDRSPCPVVLYATICAHFLFDPLPGLRWLLGPRSRRGRRRRHSQLAEVAVAQVLYFFPRARVPHGCLRTCLKRASTSSNTRWRSLPIRAAQPVAPPCRSRSVRRGPPTRLPIRPAPRDKLRRRDGPCERLLRPLHRRRHPFVHLG